MKNIKYIIILLFTLNQLQLLYSQDKYETTIKFDLETTTTINKDIYGHFAEHLGRCIYDGIWVGENSTIPNIRGYRKDIVDALKAINIPVLRWPGGCFADTYHWKDGIGQRDKRASIVNVNWGGVTEDNSFGTHEFLDLCELLGCDAYVSGNAGSGTVQEMAEWAEYMTSSNESPMTNLRKKNGREKPWRVKYFGIGNEAWGCGGDMTAEYYADICRKYGLYLNYANGNLIKVASGGPENDYDHWADVIMKNVGNSRIQGFSLHYYTFPGDWNHKGSATVFNEESWFTVMRKTMKMDTLIERQASIMNNYDKENKVGLMVDEWGTWCDVEPGTNPGFLFQQNSLRDAMVAAVNLNIFNNHADRVKMTNIAQVVNVLQSMILTKDNKMVLTPTYYVYKMFKGHQNATLIPISLKTTKYHFRNDFISSINASASKDITGKIAITIVNLDPNNSNSVNINIDSYKSGSLIKAEIITADSINAYNQFDAPEQVTIRDFSQFKINNKTIQINIPSKSIVKLEIK